MVTATCSGGESPSRSLDLVADASIRAACDGPGEAPLLFREHRVATLRQISVRAADRLLDVHRRGVEDEVLDVVVVEILVLDAFDRVARIVVVDLVGCGDVGSRALERDRAGGGGGGSEDRCGGHEEHDSDGHHEEANGEVAG